MNELRQRAFEESAHEIVGPDRMEMALQFELAKPSRTEPDGSGGDLHGLVAAALDRVHEVGEAIRAAEARARAVEAQARKAIEIAAHELIAAKSRIQAAEAQVRAGEERARRAELRAEEAEGWLRRLSETIASVLPLPSSPEAHRESAGQSGSQGPGTISVESSTTDSR